jgi:hypothetical protein
MHVCAGPRRQAEQFEVGLDGTLWIENAHVLHVREGRQTIFSRKLAHGRHLLATGTRRIAVTDADADAQSAFLQTRLDVREDLVDLLFIGNVVHPFAVLERAHDPGERGDGLAVHRRFRVLHEDPRAVPGRRDAIVERAAFFRAVVVELTHRQHAALEIQGRRASVKRLHAVAGNVLPVGVHVDEPGRDDHARDVDDFLALERRFRHRAILSPLMPTYILSST